MTFDLDLDIMGATPALFKLYTQLAFVYRMPEATPKEQISSALNLGLERLSAAFPWVAGQVVNTNPDAKSTPKYKIRQLKPTPELVIKDYTNDPSIPTFSQLKEAKYPMSMLSEDTWAPCSTLAGLTYDPSSPDGDPNKVAPVMLVQISFVAGGLVLCINLQHNVCDMTGQETIMSWLSKACRGEDFTEQEMRLGQIDRATAVPLITEDNWTPGNLLDHQIIRPQQDTSQESTASTTPAPDSTAAETPEPPPSCSWSYFNFSATALDALKRLASQNLPSSCKFISTDDAISAFIFQSILRARKPRLQHQQPVTFARAVDARRYLDVDPAYPGILQNMAYVTYELPSLLTAGLGQVAASMRKEVDPTSSDITLRTRALVTYLAQSPENSSTISFTASLKTDRDIMLSSWAKIAAYNWDFGFGLGKPEAVRRPALLPVESLMYIMPKDGNGDIAVGICLRREDLERLVEDAEWTKYATCAG